MVGERRERRLDHQRDDGDGSEGGEVDASVEVGAMVGDGEGTGGEEVVKGGKGTREFIEEEEPLGEGVDGWVLYDFF